MEAEQPDIDAITGLNNLAKLYTDQGRYAEAEQLYQRTLPICERAWGREHYATRELYSDYGSMRRTMESRRKPKGWKRALHLFLLWRQL
ncbi:MAG TPA: tetratricopeptide repeat protein [Ktedonobacteraceae bacterium]|nr:tetratricopeptide repeat protein [Ktedonobacteraceae bacterium]